MRNAQEERKMNTSIMEPAAHPARGARPASTAHLAGTAHPATTARMAFVDNIRWTVIAMVVLVHAAVTYSGLGSWYYKEPASLDIVSQLVFFVYEMFSQAFFMG